MIGKRKAQLFFAVFIIILAVAVWYGSDAKGAAASTNYPQPATIGWNKDFSPSSLFTWNSNMTYLFTLTSHSAKTQLVNITISSWGTNLSAGPLSVRHLYYKLRPGQTIKRIRYDMVTPTGPAPFDDYSTLTVEASAEVEGYPANTVSAQSELDRGK